MTMSFDKCCRKANYNASLRILVKILLQVYVPQKSMVHQNIHICFKYCFNIRNIELKMSKHKGRTCLRSVALKVEDTALIWMLTSARNKKSLVNAKCYREEIMSSRSDVSYSFMKVYIPIIFLHSLVDLVTASHIHL